MIKFVNDLREVGGFSGYSVLITFYERFSKLISRYTHYCDVCFFVCLFDGVLCAYVDQKFVSIQ